MVAATSAFQNKQQMVGDGSGFGWRLEVGEIDWWEDAESAG